MTKKLQPSLLGFKSKIDPRYEVYKNRLARRRQAVKKYMKYGLDEHLAECVATGIVDNCPICMRVQALVLDHDHVTGKARGLLCTRCNLLLGAATDDEDILHRAVVYLRKKGL
jgi:Recombination endonuclease VII